MKKLLLLLMMGIILASSVMASHLSLPMVLYGDISFNGYSYAYQDVKVTHLGTGYSWHFKSNENGIYQIDLSNLHDANGFPIYPGSSLKVTACMVEMNSNCAKTYVVSYDPYKLDFKLSDTDKLSSSGAITTQDLQKQIEAQKVVCPTCPAIPEEKVCIVCQTDSEKDEFIKQLIIGLVGIVGIVTTALLQRYSWSKSFGGLINYYLNKAKTAAEKKDFITAKKELDRVLKSIETVVTKDLQGKYK